MLQAVGIACLLQQLSWGPDWSRYRLPIRSRGSDLLVGAPCQCRWAPVKISSVIAELGIIESKILKIRDERTDAGRIKKELFLAEL